MERPQAALTDRPNGSRAAFGTAGLPSSVEQVPEQAIRAVMGEIGATIVDGPFAAGFYLVDVSLDRGVVRTNQEALQALRGSSEVIRFAELVAQ